MSDGATQLGRYLFPLEFFLAPFGVSLPSQLIFDVFLQEFSLGISRGGPEKCESNLKAFIFKSIWANTLH